MSDTQVPETDHIPYCPGRDIDRGFFIIEQSKDLQVDARALQVGSRARARGTQGKGKGSRDHADGCRDGYALVRAWGQGRRQGRKGNGPVEDCARGGGHARARTRARARARGA